MKIVLWNHWIIYKQSGLTCSDDSFSLCWWEISNEWPTTLDIVLKMEYMDKWKSKFWLNPTFTWIIVRSVVFVCVEKARCQPLEGKLYIILDMFLFNLNFKMATTQWQIVHYILYIFCVNLNTKMANTLCKLYTLRYMILFCQSYFQDDHHPVTNCTLYSIWSSW